MERSIRCGKSLISGDGHFPRSLSEGSGGGAPVRVLTVRSPFQSVGGVLTGRQMGWPQLIPRQPPRVRTWPPPSSDFHHHRALHHHGSPEGSIATPSSTPPPRAQAPLPLCYTSACIKSRVRDWPDDRDGNLVSHQGATASLERGAMWLSRGATKGPRLLYLPTTTAWTITAWRPGLGGNYGEHPCILDPRRYKDGNKGEPGAAWNQ